MLGKTKGGSPYCVYMLRCEDDSLYTGITNDLTRRFEEHLAGIGGRYTRAHRPVEIVYSGSAGDRSSASKREAEIKKWPREKKLQLIKQNSSGM